jgi:hypothetical protein
MTFDTISATVEDMAIQDSRISNTPEPAWWLDDNTPGVGERPDWLPTQFKKASDVAKSYAELQKRFGEAPSEYSWEAGKGWVEPDYEPFQELAQYAKSKRVPQDVMDKMLSSVGKYLDEFGVDYEAEKAALGDDADQRLDVLNNWAKSNLSENAFFALTSNLRTADSVMALEELRSKMLGQNTMIPGNQQSQSDGALTLDDLQAELTNNIQKYKSDPRYRREITEKIERLQNNK